MPAAKIAAISDRHDGRVYLQSYTVRVRNGGLGCKRIGFVVTILRSLRIGLQFAALTSDNATRVNRDRL
jgi:hypothetical protein